MLGGPMLYRKDGLQLSSEEWVLYLLLKARLISILFRSSCA